MTIVYRAIKGSNLTADEVDGNFHDVDDRITALGTIKSIDNIAVVGSTMTITYTDLSTDVETLPIATLNWTGAFAAGPYAVNDALSFGGSAYVVVIAHTATDPFDPFLQSGGNDVYKKMISFGGAPVIEVTPDTSGTFSPTEANANAYHRVMGECDIIIPDDGTAELNTGDELHFRQCFTATAAGLTFTPESTAVIINIKANRDLSTDEEGDVVTFKKVGANEWDAFGNLSEISA